MEKAIIDLLIKDKYYDYLKQNSNFIKDLNRNPANYKKFKEFIKDKYHLRVTDKVSTVIDDIELVSSVISTLK